MTDRTAATRYARALLDVSLTDGHPQRVEPELAAFGGLLQEHATLGSALLNPAIAPLRKRAVVSDILERTGDTSAIVSRLLLMLAERDRLGLLSEILEVYRGRLMDHLQVVRARITTATPLSAERQQSIERTLAQATGRQVMIETSVDPALVGGLVTQIGSKVYDGSVARHLDRLKQRFMGQA